MKTGENVLSKISDAKKIAEQLAITHPYDAPWPTLLALLVAYEKKINDHWPLTSSEKKACKIGWFSVRNIEEVFPDLHEVLSNVAYNIRHSGEI